ncbi:MAG: apolipoprotein N-acyltransferase, partial [Gammaproteobacteria bacterium]|nr:apolipoprotein N-acyltransferase [Gammaproteobacteria bacterium]
MAAVLGALAATALPPIHAVPLLAVSFTGLVWLIHSVSSPWRAAATGWCFGFAHFIAGMYWMAPATLRFTDSVPKAAVGLLGLSAVLAVFLALATFAARLPSLSVSGRVLALAIAWSASEWLRCNVLSGFPMNLLGTVWMPSPAMLQFTSLAGTYGLGFITVLAAAAPAVLCPPGRTPGRHAWILPAASFGLLVAVWAGGAMRLALAPDPASTGTRLRLVQANVQQKAEWPEQERMAILDRHLRLSRLPGFEAADVVIWPETAVTFYLAGNVPLRTRLSRAAPPQGHLLTGSWRRTRQAGRTTAVWNSLHALTPEGDIAATYDKHHLVPFAEYVPLRE